MKGLYAIVDLAHCASRGLDPVEVAAAILTARPAALQLRAKDAPARAVLCILRSLLPLCRNASVPLIANDRADLAALAGCDFVHIGQDDMPYDLVHRIAPQLKIGVSTHDREQLERALDAKPDYVAFGPVFATATKKDHAPVVGLDGLEAASAIARRRGVPLVAIGGITIERVAEVSRHADACAVIGDLVPSNLSVADLAARASAFHRAAGGEVAFGAECTNEAR